MYFLIQDVTQIYQETIINIDFDWKFFGDYSRANLSKCSETKICFNCSPNYGCKLIHDILDRVLDQVLDQLLDQVLDQVLDQLLDQVLDQVLNQVDQ